MPARPPAKWHDGCISWTSLSRSMSSVASWMGLHESSFSACATSLERRNRDLTSGCEYRARVDARKLCVNYVHIWKLVAQLLTSNLSVAIHSQNVEILCR